jgi:hypothetical protein
MPGAATVYSGHRFHCLPLLSHSTRPQLTNSTHSPLVSVHPHSISCFQTKLFFKSNNRFSVTLTKAADSSTTTTSQSSDVPKDGLTLIPDDEISITKVYFLGSFSLSFFLQEFFLVYLGFVWQNIAYG